MPKILVILSQDGTAIKSLAAVRRLAYPLDDWFLLHGLSRAHADASRADVQLAVLIGRGFSMYARMVDGFRT